MARDSGSSGSGPRFMRRASSPALSVVSHTSEHSDFRPSSTRNRLLTSPPAVQPAQGFRPVHIPSLTSALSPHLKCPDCRRTGCLHISISDEPKHNFEAGVGVAEFVIQGETDNGPGQTFRLNQAHTTAQEAPVRGRLRWAIGTRVGAGHERSEAKRTNNTGELVALLIALQRAGARPRGSPKETVWVDSLYARNITMGIWMPNKENVELARELRMAWRQTQLARGRGAVRIDHVRSHTGVPGNELADRLAEFGRLLDPYEEEVGVVRARSTMATIALAANARDQQRGGAPVQTNPRRAVRHLQGSGTSGGQRQGDSGRGVASRT